MHLAPLHERGNNGVKRTLAWLQRVGMRPIERKQGAAVLQDESHSLHHYAGAEAGVIALNERRNVPVLIDRGEVSGVTGGGISRARIAVGFVGIDFGGPL